jgi:XTP/dITP diphosphohydrolase
MSTIQRVVIATNNRHKLEEIRQVVRTDVQLVTLQEAGCFEELAEDQDTIEGNSFQKADYVFRNYHLPTFADDSGLEVDALHGAPGVYSAMYAGPQRSFDDNMTLLLKNLADQSNRHATFKTVITYIDKNGSRQFDGLLKGVILNERRGAGGFGYDPLFLPDGHSKTLAEMGMDEKNKISHRSIAVKKLTAFLNQQQ